MMRILFTGLMAIMMLSACSNYDNHKHSSLSSGEDFFNHHCSDCHGYDGTGMLVKQTPANILTQQNREGVVDYITNDVGVKREMPVFHTMPYAEAVAIANHLVKLQQDYEKTPNEKKKLRALMISPGDD